MKGGIVGLNTSDELVPHGRGKYFSTVDCLLDECGALRKDAPSAQGIMPDFAVSHIIVRGHPDSRSMGLECGEEFAFKKFIKTRRLGHKNPIRCILFPDPNAVENDQ